MADVSSIALPIVTGVGGILIGAGFGRITSRNDQRRDRYSDALSAADALAECVRADDGSGRTEAEKRVAAQAAWLSLDSVPVSEAYRLLTDEARRPSDAESPRLDAARLRYIDRARTFSRWTLLRRFRLQIAAERKAGRAP